MDAWANFITGINTIKQTHRGRQAELYDKFVKWFGLRDYLNSCKIILITGTNGKTTTSKMLYQYLIQHNNVSCGLFISPHLLNISERIQANGEIIQNFELIELWERVKGFCKNNNVIYFTILFFMSLIWFKSRKIRYLVIECGIGARNDVTINLPNNAGVITSIDFDHENLLGKSLKVIAQNKVAVLKNNCLLFASERRPQIRKIFSDTAKKVNGNVFFTSNSGSRPNITKRNVINVNYQLDYDSENVILVSLIVKHWLKRSESVKLISEKITKLIPPIYQYFWAEKGLKFYFFTSHNPAAVANTLFQYHKQLKIDIVIFSAVLTKDYIRMLDILKIEKTSFVITINNNDLSIQNSHIPVKYMTKVKPIEIINRWSNLNLLVIGTHQLVGLIFNIIRQVKC